MSIEGEPSIESVAAFLAAREPSAAVIHNQAEDTGIATDDEMREALRRWSRARGFTCDETGSPAMALAWAHAVETDPEPVDVGRCPACVKRGGTWEWQYASSISSRASLLADGWDWLGGWITVDGADVWPVSRRCAVCSGSGREHDPVPRLLRKFATTTGRYAVTITGCDGTLQVFEDGRPLGPQIYTSDIASLEGAAIAIRATVAERARATQIGNMVTLDAAGRVDVETTGNASAVVACLVPRQFDHKALEALTVLADQRQAAGDPLGETLANALQFWLDGRRDGTKRVVEVITDAWRRRTVPCDRCEETGRVTYYTVNAYNYSHMEIPGPGLGNVQDCPDCHGDGRVVKLSVGEWVVSEHVLPPPPTWTVSGPMAVRINEHTYSTTAAPGATASEIAAALVTAFNKQGGPATFSDQGDGVVTVTPNEHASVASIPIRGERRRGRRAPERPRHIGERLARRLGVRSRR